MPSHRPQILETSQTLRDCFAELHPNFVKNYDMDLMLHNPQASIECDDTIFFGGDQFIINATDDNRFYICPVFNDPDDTDEDRVDRAESALADLHAGVPVSVIFSGVTTPNYYGTYTTTCADAIATALMWKTIDPHDIPKCYNSPIQKDR